MFNLTITRLKYGWADLEIVFNQTPIMCYFEYVPNNALGDLLYSAYLILQGRDATICFHNCSEQTNFNVYRINAQTCKVEIDEYTLEMPIKQYVKAILRMFDKYVYAHSKEEYSEAWRFSYPDEEVEELRARYKAL